MEVIHYSFDALRLGGLEVRVQDDGGSFDVALDTEELIHSAVDTATRPPEYTDTPARLSSIVTLAATLETALNAGSSGAGTYTVVFDDSTPTFYTINYAGGGSVQLDFRSATLDGGPRLAAALGMDSSAVLAFATSHVSTVRPYYLLIPVAMARTGQRPDRGDANIATDAPTDGGVYGQITRSKVVINKEWKQAGENDSTIGSVAYDEPGTPVHAHLATSAVPWSYQHAWAHACTYKCAIKVIDDVAAAYAEVHEMRADGLTFSPEYTGADDFPMYSVPYSTRLLGRILS